MDQLLALVREHPWLAIPLATPEIYIFFRARRALRGGSKKGKAAKAPKAKLPLQAKLILFGFVCFFGLVIWAYSK